MLLGSMIRRSGWLIPALLVAVVSISGPVAAKTSPDAAAKFLDGLGRRALSMLRAQDISLEQREEKVRVLLNKNFDFARIGRFVLGKAWRTATPEQQAEYQHLFAEFVARTYAKRLGGYTGDSFKILKTQRAGKTDAVVMTLIARPSGPPLKAGWRVSDSKGSLKILDVIVEGVSMVVTQRSEFQAVIRKHGLGGLIELLRLKVNKFSAKSS